MQVMGNKVAHKELLRRVYAHPLFLTRNQIARSISHAGDEARMRTFMEKLLLGEISSYIESSDAPCTGSAGHPCLSDNAVSI